MEWRYGLFLTFLVYSYPLARGQLCDNNGLDISEVTERSVKLAWNDGESPYTIHITPHPCDENQPETYYGCACNDTIELEQTVNISEHRLEGLFPGRLYEFDIIAENGETTSGCSYTVPKQPSIFKFDDILKPNPTVRTVGVEVYVPIHEFECNPDIHSEFSNTFVWQADGGESCCNPANITQNADPDGYFRFEIGDFDPGKEYSLSIQTSSGDRLSAGLIYQENDGKFRTALQNVTNVRLGMLELVFSVVWDHVTTGPRDQYLIIAHTTVPSDITYERYERLYNYRSITDLTPGYEYELQVENYVQGYKQQDSPEKATETAIMKPQAPSKLALMNRTTDSVIVSWDPPAYANDITNQLAYNVTVTSIPCDVSTHCFCTTCNTFDNVTETTASTQLEITSLFAGREYLIEVRTVTTGPIASDPAEPDDRVYTLPRAPLAVKVSDSDTTNVSIPIDIVRGEQCENATEVERYDWYANGKEGGTSINGTLPCDETKSTISVNVDNLEPGEEYETCITTVSGNMKSTEKCSGFTKTKINAPTISSKLEDDNTTITASWNTVSGEIDGYELLCGTTQGDNRTGDTLYQNATSGKCEGVTPGALYTVTVNSVKEGYEQYAVNLQNKDFMRPYPVKPDITLEVIDTSNIKISWEITGHLDFIKYQIDGWSEEEVDASHGHIIINETLQPNGMYDISVWGVAGKDGENDLQAATQKDSGNFQMYSAEVDAMVINIENETIMEISWDNPIDNANGTGLNHYIVQLWNFEECERTIILNNTDLPHFDKIEELCGSEETESFTDSEYPIILTVYDIESCTNYTVRVIPVNTVGNGHDSREQAETGIIGPAEPFNISVDTQTATEISIQWNKPEPLNCPMSSRVNLTYIICENGSSVSEVQTLDDDYKYDFPGLQPFTDHEIIVEVFNSAGSKESYEVVKTLPAEPGQPKNLKYADMSHDSATINWEPVDPCEENGDIVGYSLEVCSRDKLGLHTEIKCEEEDIPNILTYEITGLFPYYNHTCTLRTRNEDFKGSPVLISFDTHMHEPEEPEIRAEADCKANTFTITITPDRLNGPLDGYSLELSKEDGQDMISWECNSNNCVDYGDPYSELTVKHDSFNKEINLQQDVYQILCTIKNTDFDTTTAKLFSVDGCDGSDADVGLIVGLTFMGIVIIIIVVGLIYARMKRLGPFRESDDGFSYLEGESMEAVSVGNGNTSNNHAVVGTANAAFSREDDIEVVESSRPIQIDQFEAYCNDSYEDSRYQMAEQFGVIKKQSPVYEGIECRRPENKPKNRYTNILPFDWSLVKLKTRVGVPYSEYINATYIPGERGKDEYIATQGPVTETVDDFWRMVWEQDTPIVIMLTVFVQNNKAKCVMYWPEAGSTMVCGDILVTTKSSDSWGYDDQYRTREIHLKCNDQVRVITQYQMVEWPDYGCPDSPDELLDLVETVRQQCPDKDMTRLVVHCSAGVGRTGTYIAVDRLRQQLDKKEPTDTIDIQAMISEMREYRPHMVQTEAQYTYIHDCVNAMLLRKHGQNVDNGEVDIYENTDYPRKVSAESADSDNPTMSGAMPYPIKVSADSTDSDKPTMSGTMSMSVIV